MTDDERENLYLTISELTHLRQIGRDLQAAALMHPAIPTGWVTRWRREVSQASLLLEAELRFWYGGDDSDPGERLHLQGPDGVSLCRDAKFVHARWADNWEASSCPACVRASWEETP